MKLELTVSRREINKQVQDFLVFGRTNFHELRNQRENHKLTRFILTDDYYCTLNYSWKHGESLKKKKIITSSTQLYIEII